MLRRTVFLLASVSVSSGAWAQAAPSDPDANASGIQDIVVTAQRREESLQDVPLAVTALGAQQLASRGITSLSGLLTSSAPGLTVVPFAGSDNQLVFNIRGVASIDPGVGLNEQGVAVYTDGVPLGRTQGLGIELADLERIEILRGPQGTLFGRNAEGGAVQFVSKRPTGEWGAQFQGQIGNFASRRGLVQLNLPEFANISVKIGGLVDRHDGYTRNKPLGPMDSVTAHQDFNFKNNKGFRVAALWQPTDDFDAYYSYDWSKLRATNQYQQRTGGRVGVTAAFAAACADATPPAFCADIPGNIYQGTQAPQQGRVDESSLPSYLPENVTYIQGHGLTLSYKASDNIQLKSITGYRRLREVGQNNLGTSSVFIQFIPTSSFDGVGGDDVPVGTFAGTTGISAFAKIRQKQFSQELQAIAEFDQFNITAGLFYYNEKVSDYRESLFTYQYLTSAAPGVLVPIATDPFSLGPNASQFDAEANSYAAFAQGTYIPAGLEDRLKLTVGLRFTRDKKRFHRVLFGGAPDNTIAPVFKESRVDPAFTIAYDVADHVNVYGKYSSAYRAGGVSTRNQSALNTYDAEENSSFELGFKSDLFDRRVRWNVAAFYSRIKGLQTSQGNDPTNPASTTTINLDSTIKFYGFESELTVAPADGLILGLNYALLKTKAPDTITDALGTYPLHIPNAPKHQLIANVDYSAPLSGDVELVFHADYNYTSDYVSNPVEFPQTAFARSNLEVVNARMGFQNIDVGGARFGIFGFVKNLFDKEYYSYTYNIREDDPSLTTRGGIGVYGAPRTYGIEVRADF